MQRSERPAHIPVSWVHPIPPRLLSAETVLQTWTRQRAHASIQHTAYSKQHTAYSIRHTAYHWCWVALTAGAVLVQSDAALGQWICRSLRPGTGRAKLLFGTIRSALIGGRPPSSRRWCARWSRASPLTPAGRSARRPSPSVLARGYTAPRKDPRCLTCRRRRPCGGRAICASLAGARLLLPPRRPTSRRRRGAAGAIVAARRLRRWARGRTESWAIGRVGLSWRGMTRRTGARSTCT